MTSKTFCDHCGKTLRSMKDEVHYTTLPFNVSSANKGESAVLCKACDSSLQQKQTHKVYVVLYGHKHGTDYWLRSTYEKAQLSVKATIREYLNDLDDEDQKKMKKLLGLKNLSKALTMWSEKTEEWFEIDSRTVDA